jgi:HAMP domain-containing protein
VLLDSGASGWTNPPEAPAVGDRPGLRGSLVENVAGQGEFLAGFVRTRGHREFRGANWLVVVRQPFEDAFAAERDLRRWIVRLGALFVLAIVVLTWVFTGRLARRLRAVATAADKIRQGDILSLIPQPAGADEVQTMCTALGGMVEDFRKKQEDAEAKPETPPATQKAHDQQS